MSENTPQPQDKFIVRLPDGMRDRIKAKAAENNRSMNAEIVYALDEYLKKRFALASYDWEEAPLPADDVLMAHARDPEKMRRIMQHVMKIIETATADDPTDD